MTSTKREEDSIATIFILYLASAVDRASESEEKALVR
jgi:hypothetical protein